MHVYALVHAHAYAHVYIHAYLEVIDRASAAIHRSSPITALDELAVHGSVLPEE